MAYETLSDPTKRSQYDRTPKLRTSTSSSPTTDEPSDGDYYDDVYDSDDEIVFDFERFGGFGGRPRVFFSGGFTYIYTRRSPPDYEEMERRFREQEQREADQRRIFLAEMLKREQEAERLRKAREEEKKAQAEAKIKATEKREEDERKAIEARWKEVGAVTESEKQDACYHSAFWPKVQQRKKLKCRECGVKRGMVAFKCPHCALLACQVCVNAFAAKR